MYIIEFPFNKIVRLYSTAYYRIKNSLQILFWSCRLFKGVLKIFENVQENFVMEFFLPNCKSSSYSLQPYLELALNVFKILENSEITCAVEFIFTESGANRFSIRDLSTQF